MQRSKSPPDVKYTANEVNDESKSPLYLNNQHNDIIKNSTKQILSPPSQTKLERASSFKKRSRPENAEKSLKTLLKIKKTIKGHLPGQSQGLQTKDLANIILRYWVT